MFSPRSSMSPGSVDAKLRLEKPMDQNDTTWELSEKNQKNDSSPVFVGICPTSFNSKDCRRITKSSTSLGFGAVQVAGSNLNFLGNISLAHSISNSQPTNNNENDCDIGWQYELWIYFYLFLILVCYISMFVPNPNTIMCFFQFWSISIFDLPSAHTERMEFL